MAGDQSRVTLADEESVCESEGHFRATFENAAVGMAHIAPEGRFTRVNQRLCEIVGHPRSELLGKRFQDIAHPDDLDADVEALRAFETGKSTASC